MSDKMCQHCQLDTAGNHQFGCPDASRISVGKIEFEKGTWFSPPLEERILKLESENARLQKENIQLKSVATKWQEKAMEWSKENAELRRALKMNIDMDCLIAYLEARRENASLNDDQWDGATTVIDWIKSYAEEIKTTQNEHLREKRRPE